MLGSPAVLAIAQRLKRTPAQVVLRWALQHGQVGGCAPPQRRRSHCQRVYGRCAVNCIMLTDNRALFLSLLQAVLPRTSKVDRLESNLDLYSFDLTDADMQQLDALDGTSPQVQQ